MTNLVAESFSTQIVPLALMQGVSLVECPGILEQVEMGDVIEVDIENAVVKNVTKDKTIQGKPFPEYIVKTMKCGGHMGRLMMEVNLEKASAGAAQ